MGFRPGLLGWHHDRAMEMEIERTRFVLRQRTSVGLESDGRMDVRRFVTSAASAGVSVFSPLIARSN